jgi:hypothetical protein
MIGVFSVALVAVSAYPRDGVLLVVAAFPLCLTSDFWKAPKIKLMPLSKTFLGLGLP